MTAHYAWLTSGSHDPNTGHQVLGGAALVEVVHNFRLSEEIDSDEHRVYDSNMDIDRTDLINTRDEFYQHLNEAFRKAEQFIGLGDVDDEDEEALADAHDERFHCEVCIVREIAGIMWEPIERYIGLLEDALGIGDDEED